MTKLLCCCAFALALLSCQKELGVRPPLPTSEPLTKQAPPFVTYSIKAGDHYCDKNEFKPVETAAMKFVVRFDSSAIYQTKEPANQDDINKLYGFSDNNANHHNFSARFGWRWSLGALRLFGYVYNKGEVSSKELAAVSIGEETVCSLQVTPTHYRFTVNAITDSLPRLSVTPKAKGYQLYPYFGGDETAPHAINIYIKDLP